VRSWNSRIRAVVRSSFRPIMRLKPETSTMTIAESLRRGPGASMVIRRPLWLSLPDLSVSDPLVGGDSETTESPPSLW